MNDVAATPGSDKIASARQLTMVVYILYAVGWLTGGFTSLVAIIVNYVKRDDMRGTLYESHFTWQIRTFWWSLLWAVVGFVTLFIGVGVLVLIAAAIWGIYRIVKGFLNWNDGKPMPV